MDYFALYNLNRKIPVLIPFSEVENQKYITIRFEEKGNNQKKVFKEEDYLFEKIANSSFQYSLKDKKGSSKNFCVDCGKNINLGSLRCQECENKHKSEVSQRKLEKVITRNELKDKIKVQSFESIGREFNVSGNTVKKWCKKYNLPYRKEDIISIIEGDWINI